MGNETLGSVLSGERDEVDIMAVSQSVSDGHRFKTYMKNRCQNMGLTLMLLLANLANTKLCKKNEKMTETLAYGYSSESTPQELSNEYQHDRVYMGFKNLSVRVLWTKVASAFEGLKILLLELSIQESTANSIMASCINDSLCLGSCM